MNTEKFKLEFALSGTSKQIIWNTISTATGLSNWFSEEVIIQANHFTFIWGETERRTAELIQLQKYSYVRFHWLDDEDDTAYFEIKMTHNELTDHFVLEITDYAETSEKEEMIEIWNAQIESLRRTYGM